MADTLTAPNVTFGGLAPNRRGTFFIQTWGCQMNEEDSEQISLHLRGIGYRPSSFLPGADVVILNTCSVRKKPEDKAFSLLGELAELKRSKPHLILGVCGCMAQARADEIKRRAPHVDFVLGTGDLGLLPGLVEEASETRRFQKRVDLPPRLGAVVDSVPQRNLGRTGTLKAFVPIQYGCDKFCTFCIVPTTRGRERSRSIEQIVEEVRALVAGGTREVTLLGQTVNSYGKNLPGGKLSFSDLLWRLSEIEGLERIRYTSPYPKDFTPELIRTIRDCPKVMEHCHLPLQSGDDEVLRNMKRLYSTQSFLEIVGQLREQIPNIGLTTDMIVGFPGETEAQFENSLRMLETLKFSGAYMFAYSPRPGTVAGDRTDQVDEATKKRRLAEMIALQNSLTRETHGESIGRTVEVLVEGVSPRNPAFLQGYSRDYKMIHFAGEASMKGSLVKVELTEAFQWGLMGCVCDGV
jgi:tRNA-2-methylthio-N6-dimethylallyladenosine synthase